MLKKVRANCMNCDHAIKNEDCAYCRVEDKDVNKKTKKCGFWTEAVVVEKSETEVE